MSRNTSRIVLTVVGVGALTGLAAGVANAQGPYDTPGDTTDSAVPSADGADAAIPSAQGGTPNHVLREAPALPLGNPVSSVFDVEAAAFRAFG